MTMKNTTFAKRLVTRLAILATVTIGVSLPLGMFFNDPMIYAKIMSVGVFFFALMLGAIIWDVSR